MSPLNTAPPSNESLVLVTADRNATDDAARRCELELLCFLSFCIFDFVLNILVAKKKI